MLQDDNLCQRAPPNDKIYYAHALSAEWFSIWARYAGLMELVDMRDLGSRASPRVGSNPTIGTRSQNMVFS